MLSNWFIFPLWTPSWLTVFSFLGRQAVPSFWTSWSSSKAVFGYGFNLSIIFSVLLSFFYVLLSSPFYRVCFLNIKFRNYRKPLRTKFTYVPWNEKYSLLITDIVFHSLVCIYIYFLPMHLYFSLCLPIHPHSKCPWVTSSTSFQGLIHGLWKLKFASDSVNFFPLFHSAPLCLQTFTLWMCSVWVLYPYCMENWRFQVQSRCWNSRQSYLDQILVELRFLKIKWSKFF